MMLKKALFASALALTVSAGAASAADLSYPAPAPAAAVMPTLIPAFVWSGGFVGVQAGYGWASTDWNGKRRGGGRWNADADGFVAGVHAGVNWQWNMLVLGADTSWSWSDVSGNGSCRNGAGAKIGCHIDQNWFGDVRGRVGVAFDRFHVYGAAGLAFSDFDVNARNRGKNGNNGGGTETGWTAGLGAEYAVTNNWVMGVEWKYSDYGDTNVRLGNAKGNVDLSTNVVQLRASYKF